MLDLHHDKILILDFGSQTTQLIARRVRELGVYCEIHPWHLSAEAIQAFKPIGIILSGGPQSLTEQTSPRVNPVVFDLGCPVLGICYGLQAMAQHFGGAVSASDLREYGFAQIAFDPLCPLFAAMEERKGALGCTDVWMSHGDSVETLPPEFTVVAHTNSAPNAAVQHTRHPFFGVQFHPEVTHTREGKQLLANFVLTVCRAEALWTADNIIEDAIARIQATVGQRKVILGLSGGVDSAVVAALLHKAIGPQLTCVFVNNGLLRLDEVSQVVSTFVDHFGIEVITEDASELFYERLRGVTDPEVKRKRIGNAFIEVFEHVSHRIPQADFLAQGTIYPDVIESAQSSTATATVIKSHHNVGGLPETMRLELIEPLRELFKDEVRQIGLALGLPRELVYRHPFPGPGLAVRILGEVKQDYLTILRHVDAIYIKELQNASLYHTVSQAFAVFLPVKAVGVKGDARHYDYVVALRAVETTDFMTADWAHLPYDFLAKVAQRIMNEVKGVSRVVYDISSKPPATIEWE